MGKLITPGELAPDFELKDTAGNTVRLSDFRGKPVVLSFLRGFM
jgi:peroxiredoxin